MPASASQVDHNIAAGDVVADLWQGENPPRRLHRAVCWVCSGGLYRRGPAGRVQCSFCRELAHEEPSFCGELAHEEPTREKGVDFLGMACSLLFFVFIFMKMKNSP
jgi:hypothetical protein